MPTKWLIRYYPVAPHQKLEVHNLEPLDIPDYKFTDYQETLRTRLEEYEVALKTGHHKKEGSIVGFNNCWIAVIEAYHSWDAVNKFFEQLLRREFGK